MLRAQQGTATSGGAILARAGDQLSGTYERERQRRRTESTVVHVTVGRTTLCGRDVSRSIDIFEPREAGCRECKRRWELATGHRRPETPVY